MLCRWSVSVRTCGGADESVSRRFCEPWASAFDCIVRSLFCMSRMRRRWCQKMNVVIAKTEVAHAEKTSHMT